MKKEMNVVGAVVVSDGKVLCVQRGPSGSLPGMWEFPGGKIESGESPRQALAREMTEELQCEVAVGETVTTTSHEYEFGTVHLTTFYCELAHGEPNLTEHAQLVWLPPHELRRLDWAPADIPAVGLITTQLAER